MQHWNKYKNKCKNCSISSNHSNWLNSPLLDLLCSSNSNSLQNQRNNNYLQLKQLRNNLSLRNTNHLLNNRNKILRNQSLINLHKRTLKWSNLLDELRTAKPQHMLLSRYNWLLLLSSKIQSMHVSLIIMFNLF